LPQRRDGAGTRRGVCSAAVCVFEGRTPCVPTQYHPQIGFRRCAIINKSTPRRLHDTLQPARLPIKAMMLSEDFKGRRVILLFNSFSEERLTFFRCFFRNPDRFFTAEVAVDPIVSEIDEGGKQ